MFESISPQHSQQIKRLITYLCIVADELPLSRRATLITRYDHIYGDLTGQRALTSEEIEGLVDSELLTSEISKVTVVLALETFFATVCNVISASATSEHPAEYLRSIANLTPRKFQKRLGDVISGIEHVQLGLRHYNNSFELDWYLDATSESMQHALRQLVVAIAALWEGNAPLLTLTDPMQMIHDQTFPRNLVHVTGQFYTPPWLCEQLIADLDIDSKALIIDPFCGSGAFLVCALEFVVAKGIPIELAMQNVLGIDLNPSACIAARTNLVLFARKSGVRDFRSIAINILCADSLEPAVVQGAIVSRDLLGDPGARILVDGEIIDVDPSSKHEVSRVAALLSQIGIATETWLDTGTATGIDSGSSKHDLRNRKIAEQLAVFMLRKANVLLTNPPWVGWEYMSRPYRDYLNPAWGVYSLFEQKGMQAAFLKEDLSTLCIATSCDRYVEDAGQAALVIRPAAMQSDLAARGLRRLSLFADGGNMQLQRIRIFDDLKVFGNADAPAASWQLKKGEKTTFPVPVQRWVRSRPRWQPTAATPLAEVQQNVHDEKAVCSPSNPDSFTSRWAIADEQVDSLRARVVGTNELQPRIGFFTGGANAVYYMRLQDDTSDKHWRCENITERAKRQVAQVLVDLEPELIFKVVRGRDISFWASNPDVYVLCPHSRETKIYPFGEPVMKSQYPLAFNYLNGLKETLVDRKGFAGWEKKVHQDYFYTLQRIGEYSFAPFKVCWSYISEDFVVSVVSSDKRGKAILPNDKVVFVACNHAIEAYFMAGVLSSSPIRLSVVSSVTSRQVSTNVIRNLALPKFDENNPTHCEIGSMCEAGHQAMAAGDVEKAVICYEAINKSVGMLYSLTPDDMAQYQKGLQQKLGFYPFRQYRC